MVLAYLGREHCEHLGIRQHHLFGTGGLCNGHLRQRLTQRRQHDLVARARIASVRAACIRALTVRLMSPRVRGRLGSGQNEIHVGRRGRSGRGRGGAPPGVSERRQRHTIRGQSTAWWQRRQRGGSSVPGAGAGAVHRTGGRRHHRSMADRTARGRGRRRRRAMDGAIRHHHRAGRPSGERTMLADRATCVDLPDPDRPGSTACEHCTSRTTHSSANRSPPPPPRSPRWAHERGIVVSVDASSAALLRHDGAEQALGRIAGLGPQVVLANELEAEVLGPGLHPDRLGGAVVVVKHGAQPTVVVQSGLAPVEVPGTRGTRRTTPPARAMPFRRRLPPSPLPTEPTPWRPPCTATRSPGGGGARR